MKKTLTGIVVLAVALAANWFLEQSPADDGPALQAAATGQVASARQARRSDVIVEDQGVLIKALPDDLVGSRHQRLLLKLAEGGTLLIAHNIDLAPRVADPRPGDHIRFKGEYEYNDKGGVVHWTHHDPAGKHPGGWLRHGGKVYQ